MSYRRQSLKELIAKAYASRYDPAAISINQSLASTDTARAGRRRELMVRQIAVTTWLRPLSEQMFSPPITRLCYRDLSREGPWTNVVLYGVPQGSSRSQVKLNQTNVRCCVRQTLNLTMTTRHC
jgi:hypothetical protein